MNDGVFSYHGMRGGREVEGMAVEKALGGLLLISGKCVSHNK